MKKCIALLTLSLSPISGLIPLTVHAQPVAQGLAPLTGVLGTQAGAYEFISFDKGKLQQDYLRILEGRSKEDRDYFLRSVESIEGAMKTFLNETVYGATGLKSMSDMTKGQAKMSSAKDFLQALNEYHTAKAALENRIRSLTAIAGSLPSVVDVQGNIEGVNRISGYGNINFAAISDFYLGRLTELNTFLSNLPQMIQLANGGIHIIKENSGEGLILAAQDLMLPPAEILKLKKNVLELKRWNAEAEHAMNEYTVYVRKLVQTFVRKYGKEEKFRFQDDAARKAFQQNVKEITDAFWTRSYVRALFGMPIGTIGISYQKRVANLDIFAESNKALASFHEEPLWLNAGDAISIEQSYRLALSVANARSTNVLDGDTGFLTKINSFLTFVQGEREMAKTLQAMLKLLAADFYEEKLINEAGGLKKMIAHYKARYYSTQEDEAHYTALKGMYDPSSEDDNNDTGIGVGSLKERFEVVRVHMETKEVDLELAREIEAQIANAANTANSETVRRRRARRDSL